MNRTMLRFLPFLTLSLLLAGPLQAQPRGGAPGGNPGGTITGTAVDSTTGDPLVAVTVAVWNAADSSIVTGTIGQKDGTFAVGGIKPGRYYVRLTYIGYLRRQIDNIEIRPGAEALSLGRVALMQDPSVQSEVVVTAQKRFMQVGIDRTTYQTKDLLVANGGTATDLLRNIPSVEVDANGAVNLRGSTNLVVQINGRPVMLNGASLATFLQGLPANAIERIEVIPNPSAKYDPEGMSGIINIVMKQDAGKRGFSGGVNGSVGSTGTANLGGNVSYGDGPWSLFANYGFNRGARLNTSSRYVQNVSTLTGERISGNDTGSRLSHVFTTSVDYMIAPGQSLFVSGMINAGAGDDLGRTMTTTLDPAGAVIGSYDRLGSGHRDDFGADGRLGYKWTMEPMKQELSVEGRFRMDSDRDEDDFTQRSLQTDGTPVGTPSLQRTTSTQKNRSLMAQADYFMPLLEGKLEAGYKGERQNLDNAIFSESFDQSQGEFMPDVQINNEFDFEQVVHAGYLQIGREFGPLGVQVGLRGESVTTNFHLLTNDSNYANDYTSLFPSAFLTYKPIEDLLFKASYSKRINRPGVWSLNPFASFDNPRFRRTGNPALRPEYTHAFEFGVTHFTDATTFSINPFYRNTVDAIRRLEFFDSTGVGTTTFVNFDRNETYGADVIGTLRLGESFSGMLNLSGYQSINDATSVEPGMGVETFIWNVRANITAQLPWDLESQLTYFYRPPMEIEGGTVASHQMLDLALQKKLFEGRGRVGIRVADPFATMGFHIERTADGYFQETDFRWNSRALFLTFSYNFGSPSQPRRDRPTQQRPAGSEDPMGGM
jgi:outer membrane receptor protein involved in Fe transport